MQVWDVQAVELLLPEQDIPELAAQGARRPYARDDILKGFVIHTFGSLNLGRRCAHQRTRIWETVYQPGQFISNPRKNVRYLFKQSSSYFSVAACQRNDLVHSILRISSGILYVGSLR